MEAVDNQSFIDLFKFVNERSPRLFALRESKRKAEEKKREKEKYVYKDDICKRVEKTMENVASEKEFLEKLFDNGVVAKKTAE